LTFSIKHGIIIIEKVEKDFSKQKSILNVDKTTEREGYYG
jgi:hypothetical protein